MAVIGRFAPSPTGPLHAGSLVAALASWLDVRARGAGQGRWLVRIEDVDRPRCPPGADQIILGQLAACGLHADAPPMWQSSRDAAYAQALQRLHAAGAAYPCACTRADIERAWAMHGHTHQRFAERIYPGTCRPEQGGLQGRTARGWRLHVRPGPVRWHDLRLGSQMQDVAAAVGDFILRRTDGLWAYQLAVVVDDAHQGITHVVRGEDLADNTARQIVLQRALALPTPAYLHTPLVRAGDGHKLSKQNGAAPLDLQDPVRALQEAGRALGLPPLAASTPAAWLAQAVHAWAGIIQAFSTRSKTP